MQFRRQLAGKAEEQSIQKDRALLHEAKDVLDNMLQSPAVKGTVKKDRLKYAQIFRDVATVLETKKTEGTMFHHVYSP